MQIHEHHIVPKYANGTNHKSNLIKVDRKDHALLHWYAYCNKLDLILEIYKKYNFTPTQEQIEQIPLGDKRDSVAAVFVSKNEMDEIVPQTGEDHVSYIDGRAAGKKFANGEWNDIMKKYQKGWFQEWKEANPEKYQKKLERARQYKKDNRPRMNAMRKAWVEKNKQNPEWIEERRRKQSEYRQRKRMELKKDPVAYEAFLVKERENRQRKRKNKLHK